MKNLNIGVANLIVSNSLKNTYLDESVVQESKQGTADLFKIVKNSPILQLEFKVFNNIENKFIESDTLAPRYVDKNIQLFEVYTLEELNEEHLKLKSFVSDDIIVEDTRIKLYNSIQYLIEESLKVSDEVDVDLIHESFSTVLEHVKKPKKIEEVDISDNVNERVVEIAIDKFNEKYSTLNEDELSLFKKLVNSTDSEKEDLFEEYKENGIKLLKKLNEESNSAKVTQSINKIVEMKYDSKDADNNIISLFELKQGLQ